MQYDYQALEKHILDKFIHGKPGILSDVSQAVCRDTSTVALDVVRTKISPQVCHYKLKTSRLLPTLMM